MPYSPGTLISFRVGPEDAWMLAHELDPVFTPLDLMNLASHDVYLGLMIDGAPSKRFQSYNPCPVLIPGAIRGIAATAGWRIASYRGRM